MTPPRDPEAAPAGRPPPAGGAGKTPAAPSALEAEAEQARRYLDLWERTLAHSAVHGPAAAAQASAGAAPAAPAAAAPGPPAPLAPAPPAPSAPLPRATEPAPSARPAPHRLGAPSPLVFHLSAALAGYQQALLAAPKAHDARFPWAPHLRGAAAGLGELSQIAVAAEIGRRLAATARGIELWQAHPFRREAATPPAAWARGTSRLLDYGRTPEAAAPDGPPVLVVPSLINRATILDLLPERSLLRFLAGQGLRPLLLDWGPPEGEARGFDIADYGAERLLPALRHVRAETGRLPAVLGYCMGGTLAAGLAARAPGELAALALVGAPWDFAAPAGVAGSLRAMLRAGGRDRLEAQLRAQEGAFGAAPVPLFQLLFALVNPMQAATKFQRFARLDPGGAAARQFVAMEDWLNDGVAMAAPAARDLLVGWQIENRTARGRWHFLGGPVRPGAVAVPTIAFCGRTDSIAPGALALPLARAIPGARVAEPPTGHVGMIVGSAAPGSVWRPLAAFLAEHADRSRHTARG